MDSAADAEATPWNEGPKYLIRDRDKKYGPRFSTVCLGSGIRELKTPYRTPNANAVCERYMGSLRRECLDQHLFFSGRQLERVVKEYVSYYNQDRPHQGINQQIPINYDRQRANMFEKVRSRPVMGGLHYSYSREAAGNSDG
jgi:transposase InsO family protein